MSPLQDLRPKIKLFLLVVLVAVILIVGGILLLRGDSSFPVSEGKALIYGKAVALSDVMTIPDAPLTEGVIGAISEERFDSFLNEARQTGKTFLDQSIIFSYVVGSSSFDGQGDFQFEVNPGSYVLCYFFPATSSETMQLEACGKTDLERGEQLSIRIEKMFGASIIGEGVETIPLTDIYPVTLDSSDTSNWQTYRNDEFGFEFKYPPDWSLIDKVVMPTSYVERCGNVMSNEKDFNGCLRLGSVRVSENPVSYYSEQTDTVTKKFIEDFPQERIGDRLFYVFHDIFEGVGTNEYFTRGPDQKYYRVVYWQRYPVDPYQNYDYDENLQGIIRQILTTFRFVE